MIGEHVTFLVSWVSNCAPLADYIPIFVTLDTFYLLMAGHLGTEYVPPVINVLEIAAITAKLQHVFVFVTPGRNCDNRLPQEEAHKVDHSWSWFAWCPC